VCVQAFSGELFKFYFLNSRSETDRQWLRDTVGEEAEHLTWMFGTVWRGKLNHTLVEMQEPLTDAGIEVPHRILGTVQLPGKDVAKLLVVTMADYLDQMVRLTHR